VKDKKEGKKRPYPAQYRGRWTRRGRPTAPGMGETTAGSHRFLGQLGKEGVMEGEGIKIYSRGEGAKGDRGPRRSKKSQSRRVMGAVGSSVA